MSHSTRFSIAALVLGTLFSLLVLPLAAETAGGWEPDAVAAATPELPLAESASGPAVFALQWRLDRLGFSPGVLDGMWGANTEQALAAFQGVNGLPANGEFDAASWKALAGAVGDAEPLVAHQLTAADLGGDEAPPADGYSIPEEPVAKAELDCLCFESTSEALAERFHTTPGFLAQLNPGTDLDAASAGDRLVVPNVAGEPAAKSAEIDHLVISKQGFYLRAVDAEGNVVYHFPTTVGDGYDPSPDGEYTVTVIDPDPKFHYQPKLMSDVPDDEQDAMLPPGPNSPVGVVWMQLSKENYGIHGTAEPSTIGHSTSHGCIRLTNWDARFLAERIGEGTPVRFVDGEPDAETASERGLEDEQAEKAEKAEKAESAEQESADPGDDA